MAASAAARGHVASEGCPDGFAKGPPAIDDEEARNRWIEAALDEIIDQRLHGHRVFRGETENGVIWLYALADEGVMAFTDFGIENLVELIKIYKELKSPDER